MEIIFLYMRKNRSNNYYIKAPVFLIFLFSIISCDISFPPYDYSPPSLYTGKIWNIYDETGFRFQDKNLSIQYKRYYSYSWTSDFASVYFNIKLESEPKLHSFFLSDQDLKIEDIKKGNTKYIDYEDFTQVNDSEYRAYDLISFRYSNYLDNQLKMIYTDVDYVEKEPPNSAYRSTEFDVVEETRRKKLILKIFAVPGYGVSDIDDFIDDLNNIFEYTGLEFEYTLNELEDEDYYEDIPDLFDTESDVLLFSIYSELTGFSISSKFDLDTYGKSYHDDKSEELVLVFLNESWLLDIDETDDIGGLTEMKIRLDPIHLDHYEYSYGFVRLFGSVIGKASDSNLRDKLWTSIAAHEIGHAYAFHEYYSSSNPDIEGKDHEMWHNTWSDDNYETPQQKILQQKAVIDRVKCLLNNGGGLSETFLRTFSSSDLTNEDLVKLNNPTFCWGHVYHFHNTNWYDKVYHPLLYNF